MQKILIDHRLDEKLLQQGYVVVPFLTKEVVDELKSFYYQHHPTQLEGMYATAHHLDIDFRIQMNDFIKSKFEYSIEKHFLNCQPLGGSYIAKYKGNNGSLEPHQDWNLVDEHKSRSFNIWVPLVDLNDKNGAIMIEPGSHLWDFNYRSANIPFAYPEKVEELWKSMLRLDMKAGEALIYDHRLIHASANNESDEVRLACVFGIIPADTPMYYYHKNENGDIEVYDSNPDFFLYGNIFEGPKDLQMINVIKQKDEILSNENGWFYRIKKKLKIKI